jgi:hypothetical protein
VHDAEEAPTSPPSPAAPPTPIIPTQRGPLPGEAVPLQPVEAWDLPPFALLPGTAPLPLPPPPLKRRRGRALLVGLTMALVLAAGAGAVGYLTDREPLAGKAVAAEPSAEAIPLTPFESVNVALKAQAAALLQGDEKAWLAAVDPGQSKLRTRYRSMFTSLRRLGVSRFEYRTAVNPADKKTGTIGVTAQVEYCFSTDSCPEKRQQSYGPPTITQELKLKQIKGRYLITSLTSKGDGEQPTPWESGDLVFSVGKRVTVIGNRSERKYFGQVLAVAEKAAAVNDRFAALIGNPQRRYRIYLAGPKQWKTWYGGITDTWVIGYAIPLSNAGTDVVLNIRKMAGDRQVLSSTIQHELGHVVTLGGVHRAGGRSDLWMSEGIAEYIGWYPKSATSSWRRSAVRAVLHSSKRPKSIAARALADDGGPDGSDAFYGMGHFAADCMARKYGQGALFDFVRLYLRENRDLDPASREAFGKPFATIDKACLAWIRDKA